EGPSSPGEVVARDAVGRARQDAARDRVRGLALAGTRELHERLAALAAGEPGGSVRGVGARLFAIAADARAALDEALAAGAGSDALHRYRVAGKRLRYALEALAPIDPAA